MQSKRLTSLEVLCNTFTGMLGSWLISVYLISVATSAVHAATAITAACTVWSLLRGYVVRRIFNNIAMKQRAKEIAEHMVEHKEGHPFAKP